MDIAEAFYYFTPDDEPKKAGLPAGYGAIERGDRQETLIFIGCMPPSSSGAGWRKSAIEAARSPC